MQAEVQDLKIQNLFEKYIIAATKSDLDDHGGNRRNSGRNFRPPTHPYYRIRADNFELNNYYSFRLVLITVAVIKCLSF